MHTTKDLYFIVEARYILYILNNSWWISLVSLVNDKHWVLHWVQCTQLHPAKKWETFQTIPSIPVTDIVMEQGRLPKSSAIPTKMVHSTLFTIKFFWKSISLSYTFFSIFWFVFVFGFFCFSSQSIFHRHQIMVEKVYLNPKRLNTRVFFFQAPKPHCCGWYNWLGRF
jgi:hypothetical protein